MQGGRPTQRNGSSCCPGWNLGRQECGGEGDKRFCSQINVKVKLVLSLLICLEINSISNQKEKLLICLEISSVLKPKNSVVGLLGD
ncbi:hypothetical protein CEXT_623841 [Caerostris extrusa]|uniref:Uncharacterized protein n=1 Tax=Caerostris extrusa TaxID=172846 RepID=A0AAV4RHG8_CAEEX|nr:hypothetical protein CEXT_623841 [Caerostris extrusa]